MNEKANPRLHAGKCWLRPSTTKRAPAARGRAQAYLVYQSSVLAALQDAQTAIVRCTTERRLQLLQGYADAASSTSRIAADEYRNGIADLTCVLGAADAELEARDAVVQSRQALAQARISLYEALGGGWSGSKAPVSTRKN